MADKPDVPDNVAYFQYEKDGVLHRAPVTPEQARRLMNGEEAIGHLRGEPVVDERGKLIELHGRAEDPNAEPLGEDAWARDPHVEPPDYEPRFDDDEDEPGEHPYDEP